MQAEKDMDMIQNPQSIDITSDVVSRAPKEMLLAMRKAETGDDVFDDDPTAILLQQTIAKCLGTEDALFMPSTTMSNTAAVLNWTRPGDEVIAWANSHMVDRQGCHFALFGGVQTRQIFNQTGVLPLQDIKKLVRKRSQNIVFPTTALILLQNPTFYGRVWPLEQLKAVYEFAKIHAIKVHIDGARAFNAYTYYKEKFTDKEFKMSDMAQYCDSMSVCLTKGLCCPAGSMLVSSKQGIAGMKWIRKSLGGGMRQIGVLAAAGLYALDSIVPTLKQDHRMALLLGSKLKELKQIEINIEAIQTNMVHFKFVQNLQMNDGAPLNTQDFQTYLHQRYNIKTRLMNKDSKRFRFMTYHQIRQKQVEKVVKAVRQFLHQKVRHSPS